MYWRAMLSGKPYPITAMIIAGSNPLNKYTNTRMVYDAMKKLELIVTCDLFETPTAAMSDYLFPMSDFLERPSFNVGFGGIQPFLWAGERAVKREHERRDDYDFWRGLAIRFGQEKYWPWKTLEEVYDYRVKPASGFKSFQELVDKEPFVFMESKLKGYADLDSKTGHPRGYATPSGRVELWSIILEELGYDRLPQFKEPFISPVSRPMLAKEYPMTLISIARHMPFHHSEFYPVPSLRGMHPDPLVEIHPVTARMMSPPINNGDWVWIETPRGKIKQRATLSWGIDPQWVCVEHCWWFPEQSGADPTLHGVWQSNVNVLTEDDPDLCDPVFGTYPIATSLCRIRKCEEQ